eukprot:gene15594-biopygen6685
MLDASSGGDGGPPTRHPPDPLIPLYIAPWVNTNGIVFYPTGGNGGWRVRENPFLRVLSCRAHVSFVCVPCVDLVYSADHREKRRCPRPVRVRSAYAAVYPRRLHWSIGAGELKTWPRGACEQNSSGIREMEESL